MLRTLIPPRISTLVTRLCTPVALCIPRQRQHSGSSTSETTVAIEKVAPPTTAEPGVSINGDNRDSPPSVIQSSFADVLKKMMDSDLRPQSSMGWPRKGPPPLDKSVDLIFFQTELIGNELPDVDADAAMFGVTKDGNSICIRIKRCTTSRSEITSDTKIPGMSWVKIPATKIAHISGLDRRSHCQLELAVEWADIEIQPFEDAAPPPPLRILSFDIECLGREDIFPEPEVDPVIQIGNMVSILGSPTPPFIRNIFTLDTCSEIPGADVISFADEANLLQSWSDFVQEVDPDLIIGYNITGFDFPYLLARAKALQVLRFPFLGRLKEVETVRERTITYTIREHTRSWEDIPLPGRLQLDLMQYIRREENQRSLSLNSVSKRFLGERKEDVHFTAIRGLQTGSADTRQRLAVYCLKDTYLPQRLFDVLGCVDKYTAVAHEKGIQFNSILPDCEPVETMPMLPQPTTQILSSNC
ncbi:DNA polymerase [Mycena venus]|uniref:DNA polymerase delta catalytic subunit n=1 Tax=Mycena venus TaxID=2733690 RepID=A0A8H6YT63_9AGAR|nr:DNA polymerase [Mycena venus]